MRPKLPTIFGNQKRGKRSFLFFLLFFATSRIALSQKVVAITVNDDINPATAEYIHQGLEKAGEQKAQCLIISLNTPGGLLTSTRNIVSDIMRSQVPVIVYVFPAGSRAGSAGTFITLSANIAAMAPGTNIGAAHPVYLQGNSDAVMNEKVMNDACAFIRTIAEKRGRNVQWADESVRNSVSITEREALQKNVIDLIAADQADLLSQLNGKQVQVRGVTQVLDTKNAVVEELPMGFFEKVLSRLSDPNISYIIMMLGFYGLLFELFSPGAIFPGIVGVICLVLAFYSMSSMPVNYAGLALIVFGILLYLLELKVVSHGMLAIGGTISVLLGSLILFRTSPIQNFVTLSKTVVYSVTAFSGLFFLLLITLGVRAQRAKPVLGDRSMIGKKAIAVGNIDIQGQVNLMGEIWNAVSVAGKISANEEVVIKEIKGLTLYVQPAGGTI